jgi:hypothetical protein
MATTTDTAEYGMVPAKLSHAVARLTEAHGYAGPVELMAAEIVWNSRYEAFAVGEKCRRAAQLMAEAAVLLKQAEAEIAKADSEPTPAFGECRECLELSDLSGGLCRECQDER